MTFSKILIPKILPLCAALLLAPPLLVGCGEGGGPDPKTEKAQIDEATKIRGIFDAAGGDYAKVSAADKATFEKYAGGPAEAEKLWNGMKGGSLDVGSGPNP